MLLPNLFMQRMLLLLLPILCCSVVSIRAEEIWFGTSPFCDADARDCEIFDMNYVKSDKYGDGKYCLTGKKVLCRSKQLDRELTTTENNKLAIVSYNIYERPFFITHDGQTERTCHITRALLSLLPHTDVIIFEEAFLGGCMYDNSRLSLKSKLSRRGFPYATEIVGSFEGRKMGRANDANTLPYFIINGGVFIASRHPIVATETIVYKDAGHADKFSNKGAVYAKIVKGDTNYHVFGTHMQAQMGASYDAIRVKQAVELQKFIANRGIPTSEPVIIGGDFNCDSINNPPNVRDVVNAMKAVVPPVVGNVDATFDPFNNDVVEPGNTVKEWLDYVVTSNQHKRPVKSQMQAFRLQADQQVTYCNSAKLQPFYVWPWSSLCGSVKRTNHLSDHFPVLAEFEF